MQPKLQLGAISGHVNIPLTDLKQGSYIVDLHSGDKIVKSTKLLIEK